MALCQNTTGLFIVTLKSVIQYLIFTNTETNGPKPLTPGVMTSEGLSCVDSLVEKIVFY